jgi:predicted O-linked N-acetylglucosamine transferase (SPINDLY family)
MLHRALAGAPRNPHLWYLLGNAQRGHGDSREAQACYTRALEEAPAFAEAHNDLGNVLQDAGRLGEAESHYREALRCAPAHPLVLSNLGCVLLRMNRLEEGADHLLRAIILAPDYADAHLNLGTVRRLQGDRGQALACFRAALALRPDDAAIRECLLTELQTVCEWSRFDELCGLQRRAVLDAGQRVSPFSLLSIPSTPGEQLQCARAFAARYAMAAGEARKTLSFNFPHRAGRRLKIGYLSADFREHAVAHLVAELIELHDRGRFEVVGYSLGPDDGSAMRARLRRAFDDFVDLRDMPHADAAARIHAGQVDILVDLQGYTQLARTEIVALRPAPLQVSYLGFTGSMGADFIDYVVVDPFVAPPGAERDFGEKLIRLPSCFQANDRTRAAQAPPARRELGLPDDGFVFCCFNQSYKILPEVFGSWMRVLKQVPRSVLWLLEANRWAVENLRREADRAGVEPGRLVFAPFVAQSAHLARMRAADLVLDTRPYNAHTTSSDALWVGVPVVTCPGETFASRVAGSLLDAIGTPELIAASAADYEALAIRLARAPAELAALRRKIERNRPFAHMFDTPTYARNLEQAYERIWANHAAGNPPKAVQL